MKERKKEMISRKGGGLRHRWVKGGKNEKSKLTKEHRSEWEKKEEQTKKRGKKKN